MAEGDEAVKGGDTHANLSMAPYEKAADTATKGAVDAASAFLSKVCMPGLEEAGGMIRDRMSYYRQCQALKLAQKWEAKMKELGTEGNHAPPRLIETGLERGSLVDSEELCDMWAGLLASSCTADGVDDSNILFMSLLDQLTIVEAKILAYACEHALMKVTPDGLPFALELDVDLGTLMGFTGVDDLHRLDRELDHLRALDLLRGGGFDLSEWTVNTTPKVAHLTPSTLAMHLYVRCQGSLASPTEYFDIEPDASGPPAAEGP
jgi:hypothetical protein